MDNNLICLAEIVGVHGVRGAVKLKYFGANAQDLLGYAPVTDDSGRAYVFTGISPHGNIFLARIDGVADRDAAQALRGTRLYVRRDALPDIADASTYYHADLVGMAALDADGAKMGTVVAVANFGAGDLLEIRPGNGASFYIPFTDESVPQVDTAKKILTVIPPPGLLD